MTTGLPAPAGSSRTPSHAWFLAFGVSAFASRAVETSRLEIFADAIFAIAATLLILDVSVHTPGASLGADVEHAWPQYAAYGVSFLIIGIWWVNHHHCMTLIDEPTVSSSSPTSLCSRASPSSRSRQSLSQSTSETAACAPRRSPTG
jgi:hypothetical protein